jgi:hypothetical protein
MTDHTAAWSLAACCCAIAEPKDIKNKSNALAPNLLFLDMIFP